MGQPAVVGLAGELEEPARPSAAIASLSSSLPVRVLARKTSQSFVAILTTSVSGIRSPMVLSATHAHARMLLDLLGRRSEQSEYSASFAAASRTSFLLPTKMN